MSGIHLTKHRRINFTVLSPKKKIKYAYSIQGKIFKYLYSRNINSSFKKLLVDLEDAYVKVFLPCWKILTWHMLCALHCAGKMISDFRGAIETNRINLMVTLALNAGLSLNPDFPVLSLLSSVVVGRAFT